MLELDGKVYACFIQFCMMLRFNYFITKEIVNIPENAGKQEENKKLANPTLSEKTTIIFCCVPFFACMDVV